MYFEFKGFLIKNHYYRNINDLMVSIYLQHLLTGIFPIYNILQC
jgi:hypothetical protein